MDLRHYSRTALGVIQSKVQENEATWKPKGLWVSVLGEDDWLHWCEENDWYQEPVFEHEIILAPDANVLRIENLDRLLRFHEEFAFTMPWSSVYIDWARVASRYDGIIIAPYQWACRLEYQISNWYYSWDCASGCIWNAKAIAEARMVKENVCP